MQHGAGGWDAVAAGAYSYRNGRQEPLVDAWVSLAGDCAEQVLHERGEHDDWNDWSDLMGSGGDEAFETVRSYLPGADVDSVECELQRQRRAVFALVRRRWRYVEAVDRELLSMRRLDSDELRALTKGLPAGDSVQPRQFVAELERLQLALVAA